MSIQPDPYATYLLDSLLSGTKNALAGIGAGVDQYQQARLAEEAIKAYTEDPTMENMLRLSKHVNLNSVMQAALANQSRIESERGQQGIGALANYLSDPNARLSPAVLQAFANYPHLMNLIQQQGTAGPLAHLHEAEQKQYFQDQQDNAKLNYEAGLLRQIRTSPDKASVYAYAKELNMHELAGRKLGVNDLRKAASAKEREKYRQIIRNEALNHLRGFPGLSPQQRQQIYNEIISNPNFLREEEALISSVMQPEDPTQPQSVSGWASRVIDGAFGLAGTPTPPSQGLGGQGPIGQGPAGQGPTGQGPVSPNLSPSDAGIADEMLNRLTGEQPTQAQEQQVQRNANLAQELQQLRQSLPISPEAEISGAVGPGFIRFPTEQSLAGAMGEETLKLYESAERRKEQQTPKVEAAKPTEAPKESKKKELPKQTLSDEEINRKAIALYSALSDDDIPSQLDTLKNPLSTQNIVKEYVAKEKGLPSPSALPEGTPPSISFNKTFGAFKKQAKEFHKDSIPLSDEDLRSYWENGRVLAEAVGRAKTNLFGNKLEESIEREISDVDEGLPPNPEAIKNFREFALKKNKEYNREAKENAIRSSIIQTGFYEGLPYKTAEEVANTVIEGLGPEIMEGLYDTIQDRYDLSTAVRDIEKGTIDLLERSKKAGKFQAPPLLSDAMVDTLNDTLVTAVVEGGFAYLDHKTILKAFQFLTQKLPKEWIGPTVVAHTSAYIGGLVLNAIKGDVAREDVRAFVGEHITEQEKQEAYDRRRQFVEKFPYGFDDEAQKRRFLKGELNADDLLKLGALIQDKGFFERSLDLLTAPVSSLTDVITGYKGSLAKNFPNANASAVLAAEIFGASLGSRGFFHSKIKDITRTSPEFQPIGIFAKSPKTGKTVGLAFRNRPLKQTIYKVSEDIYGDYLKKLSKAGIKGSGSLEHSVSLYAERYLNHLKQWASSPGTEAYQPFFLKPYNQIAEALKYHLIGPLVIGGADYYMSNTYPDNEFARFLVDAGIGFSALSIVDRYYKAKLDVALAQREHIRSSLNKFAQDLDGFAYKPTDNSDAFAFRSNKKIFYLDETGNLSSFDYEPPTKGRPRRIGPKPSDDGSSGGKTYPPPEITQGSIKELDPSRGRGVARYTGPVTKEEYSRQQQPHVGSFMALSQLLGLGLPNIVRQRPGTTQKFDLIDFERLINENRDSMRKTLLRARNKDLRKFLPKDIQENILKDYHFSPQNFKDLASDYYGYAERAAKTLTEKTAADDARIDLAKAFTAYASVFKDDPEPTKGRPVQHALYNDLFRLIASPDFSLNALLSKRRQIAKDLRDLEFSRQREYSEDKALQIKALRFFKEAIDHALPESVLEYIRKADDLWFAYKYSESVKDWTSRLQSISSTETWLKSKPWFQKEAGTIFETFQASNVAQALKNILTFEDYFATIPLDPKITKYRGRRRLSEGIAIEEPIDVLSGLVDIKTTQSFSTKGKLARPIIDNFVALFRVFGSGALSRAMQTDPYLIGKDYELLVKESMEFHKIRNVAPPKRLSLDNSVYSGVLATAEERLRDSFIEAISIQKGDLGSLTQKHIDDALNAHTIYLRAVEEEKLKTYQNVLKDRLKDATPKGQKILQKEIKAIDKYFKDRKRLRAN